MVAPFPGAQLGCDFPVTTVSISSVFAFATVPSTDSPYIAITTASMGVASASTKGSSKKKRSITPKAPAVPAVPNKTIDSMYRPIKKEDWQDSLAKESIRDSVDSDVELASSQASLPSSTTTSTPRPTSGSFSQAAPATILVDEILQTELALLKALGHCDLLAIRDLKIWDPQKFMACLNDALVKFGLLRGNSSSFVGVARAAAISHAGCLEVSIKRAWQMANNGETFESEKLFELERATTDVKERYSDWEALRLDKDCLALICEPMKDFDLPRLSAMLTYCYRIACAINAQEQVFSVDFVMVQHCMRHLHDQRFLLEQIIDKAAREILQVRGATRAK
jgi:hypothetical protein